MSPATAAFRAARDLLLRHRSDYPSALREFAWPQLPAFNWALDHFDDLARGNHATALWIVDEQGSELKRSFEELWIASDRTANWLRSLGIARGDRLLVMLPNRVELWETMLAAIKLGAVLAPATQILSAADLQDRIERGAMRAVIADAASVAKFDGIADGRLKIVVGGVADGWTGYADAAQAPFDYAPDGPTQGSDPCVLYFTSGTTSKPKMVLHTQTSYPVGHLSTLYWLGLQPGDVHLNISSPGWAKHAWSCFFAPWQVGATVFIYNQGRFDAARTLATIARCGVTSLCAPPTAWRSLILEDLKAHPVRLRELTSAGEPLNPEVIEQVKSAWGISIREGFGQTESTAMLGNPPGQPLRPGSMGRPLPGYAIDLLDLDGKPAKEGEISVRLTPRPTAIMAGYAGDEAKTAKALGGSHYGTADVASIDADGYYWYVGRTDDVFKSSDYRISPFELESALLEHPAVAEAAVFDSPDPKRLCVPKACVVLAPGHAANADTAKAILLFARERLAPYQKIRVLEFCELPKTVSGKVRRNELRATEAGRRAAGTRGEQEYLEADFPELLESPRRA
ncbi:MAG: AMP-binding protein [Nevskia sp.]|uniref:AMP-binding protein n=1 Tax=Nevskia sp. TaxID=1929292 RepID=UPI0040356234